MTNGEFERAMYDACHPHGYLYVWHKANSGCLGVQIGVRVNAVTGCKLTMPALRDVVAAAMPFPHYPIMVLE